jgi:hypothetical protein
MNPPNQSPSLWEQRIKAFADEGNEAFLATATAEERQALLVKHGLADCTRVIEIDGTAVGWAIDIAGLKDLVRLELTATTHSQSTQPDLDYP